MENVQFGPKGGWVVPKGSPVPKEKREEEKLPKVPKRPDWYVTPWKPGKK